MSNNRNRNNRNNNRNNSTTMETGDMTENKELESVVEQEQDTTQEPVPAAKETPSSKEEEKVVETKEVRQTPRVVDHGVVNKNVAKVVEVKQPKSAINNTTKINHLANIESSDVLKLVEKGGSTLQRDVMVVLKDYAINMRPGLPFITNEEQEGGLRKQLGLWGVLQRVIRTEDYEEFRKTWTTVLSFFYEQKDGAFNPNYLYRFNHLWPRDPNEQLRFNNILNLILVSSNPETRNKVNNIVSIGKTMEGWDSIAKRNITEYYS